MIQPDAVLEVSDGVLDLGVAAVAGLQFQGFPVPVGDEAVMSRAVNDRRQPFTASGACQFISSPALHGP